MSDYNATTYNSYAILPLQNKNGEMKSFKYCKDVYNCTCQYSLHNQRWHHQAAQTGLIIPPITKVPSHYR